MTGGKTIALTKRTFVGKVKSLLFNFMAAVTICSDLEPRKIKSVVSIVSPSICHEVMGPDALILVF